MFTKLQSKDQGMIALFILALCAIALLVFGCADNPTMPTTVNDNSLFSSDKDKDQGTSDTLFVASDTISGDIGLAGGTLEVDIKGKKVEFLVRPLALGSTVRITIIASKYLVGDKTEFYTYECGPRGTQFALPLELMQSIDKTDGTVATFHYFDESLNDGDGIGWESIGTSLVQGGKGTFLVSHFSKYGISYVAGDPGADTDTESYSD